MSEFKFEINFSLIDKLVENVCSLDSTKLNIK